MKINVGTWDRVIRGVLGVAVMVAAFFLDGAWGLIGIALALSAFAAYCPIYHVFGVDTCTHKKGGLDQHA
jgi:predicted phage tail protein